MGALRCDQWRQPWEAKAELEPYNGGTLREIKGQGIPGSDGGAARLQTGDGGASGLLLLPVAGELEL